MPERDSTGPNGRGPLTGWGQGGCNSGKGFGRRSQKSGSQGQGFGRNRQGICKRDRVRGDRRGQATNG